MIFFPTLTFIFYVLFSSNSMFFFYLKIQKFADLITTATINPFPLSRFTKTRMQILLAIHPMKGLLDWQLSAARTKVKESVESIMLARTFSASSRLSMLRKVYPNCVIIVMQCSVERYLFIAYCTIKYSALTALVYS